MQPEFSPGQRPQESAPTPSMESFEMPQIPGTPETLAPNHEQYEQRSSAELAPPPPQIPAMPLPPQPAPEPSPVQIAQPVDQNPIAANDDDDIEKEWVNRAKQIITQTRDDPYARERAIGALQRDYLMKRYGREIGASND